jgi:hypothetical protein
MEPAPEDLKRLLCNGLVEITFRKKNGEVRVALATLCPNLIPDEYKPNGTGGNYTDNQLRFFEFDANQWRSCIVQNIIIVNTQPETCQ